MILQIKLLSDLCASAGENYNAYVDTDVVYDEYGLPYIPAKRVKGCIREAALELVEFGLFDKATYESLFGKEGNEQTKFSLDNAYLKGYDKIVEDLCSCQDKALVHMQRVLGLYTYTRTQTAMTKNGVADKGSLRTMRVANKGLVFEAVLRENEKLQEKQKELLEKAVSMVKHMGTARTRGLGLVELSMIEDKQEDLKEAVAYEIGESNKINYTITLNSQVLCKSSTGSQERTHDYIEGSKILGVLAQNLPKDMFSKLMNHDGKGESIIVSNAYICEAGERCTPIRASLQKQKDQVFDETGAMTVADMLVPCANDVQWTPVGNGYASSEGYMKSVDVEVNYHHRRPNDKSIGKANGKDDSTFYQLESMCRGQQFAGYILANREQTMAIMSVLNNTKDIRMGYSRNAEYGNVKMEVVGVEAYTKGKPKMTDRFVVKLNSPVILYNENGMPSADVECLKQYLAECLEVEDSVLKVDKAFLTYETIGGFNVTWHRRKPIFTALGKGTVCYIVSEKPVDIVTLQRAFIGERVAEGYGEIEVFTELKERAVLRKAAIKTMHTAENQTDILSRLTAVKCREEISSAGVAGANEILKSDAELFGKHEFKAALNKLIIIAKAEATIEKVKEQVSGIESVAKKKICEKLLEKVEKELNNINDVCDKEELKKVYLHSFLNQIKYATYKKGERTNE